MAQKNNESVNERRLKPIYDWLDNGNNKKAVQEADKVLRKQPKLQCAIVLKALALLRLGRSDECPELIDSVVSEGTSDDATLQALTIYFREIHELDLICQVFERASEIDPANEEILSHLFMAYVRVGNYKKQQHTAMQLYKLKPKNPYYFWGVMSIVMQAHVSKNVPSKQISLQLAERMVLKFVNENKIDSEAEVLTYLYILEIQGKYSEALNVLNGPLVKKITQQTKNYVPMKKATYHSHLEQFHAANGIYTTLMYTEPDNWQHYVNLVNTALSLYTKSDSTEVDKDTLTNTAHFLKDIKETTANDPYSARSPYLGQLQLALKLKKEKLTHKTEELCGSVPDLFLTYAKFFGDKMCCFADIINFLPLLSDNQGLVSFLNDIEGLVQLDPNGVPVDVKNVYRHQLLLQLRRYFRDSVQRKFEPEQEIQRAEQLLVLYNKTDKFSVGLATTDIRPNDTYLLLAGQMYFDVVLHLIPEPDDESNTDDHRSTVGDAVTDPHSQGDKQKHLDACRLLLRLCAFLEKGSSISKANFQLKLLLIKAFNAIGAIECSYSVYEKLDLKQIQLDSMGYVLALHLSDYGLYSRAITVYSATLRFFMANLKDTFDPLFMSYKFGSLVQIPEFTDFRERLNKSLHFAAVTAEQMTLDLSMKANSSPELESLMQEMEMEPLNELTEWESLRDNRDFSVLTSWRPMCRDTLKSWTFEEDKTLLRIRSTLVRVIGAASSLRKSYTGEEKHLEKSAKNSDNSQKSQNTDKSVDSYRKSGKNPDNSGQSKKVGKASPQIASSRCSDIQGSLSNGTCNGCDSSPKNSFKELIDELRNLEQNCDSCEAERTPQMMILGPDFSRLSLYTSGGYLPLILCHGELLLRVYDGVESGNLDSVTYLDAFSDRLTKVFGSHYSHVDSLPSNAPKACPGVTNRAFAQLSHFVQSLSLSILLLDCVVSILRRFKANVTKKNKKKRPAATTELPVFLSNLNNYIASFVCHMKNLDESLGRKLENRSINETVDSMAKLSVENKNSVDNEMAVECYETIVEKSVDGDEKCVAKSVEIDGDKDAFVDIESDIERIVVDVEKSYEKVISNLRSILQSKIKFLSSFKL